MVKHGATTRHGETPSPVTLVQSANALTRGHKEGSVQHNTAVGKVTVLLYEHVKCSTQRLTFLAVARRESLRAAAVCAGTCLS